MATQSGKPGRSVKYTLACLTLKLNGRSIFANKNNALYGFPEFPFVLNFHKNLTVLNWRASCIKYYISSTLFRGGFKLVCHSGFGVSFWAFYLPNYPINNHVLCLGFISVYGNQKLYDCCKSPSHNPRNFYFVWLRWVRVIFGNYYYRFNHCTILSWLMCYQFIFCAIVFSSLKG